MIPSRRAAVRLAATLAVGVAIAFGAVALGVPPQPSATGDAPDPAAALAASNPPGALGAGAGSGAAAASAAVAGSAALDPTSALTPAFQPIDVFATSAPPPGAAPPGAARPGATPPGAARPGATPPAGPSAGDSFWRVDTSRPAAPQSDAWLQLKAAGRLTLVGGAFQVLDAAADPLLGATGVPAPAARLLDTAWTSRIVEPPAYGVDERGNTYSDSSYWNLCGPGATAVALYYWQQLTGRPDVSGTAGYFLDPYAAAGATWPSNGPRFVGPDGQPEGQGTYWSGSGRVSGYSANGRGFLMYLAMNVRPPGWSATGIDVFAANGAPYYPVRGASTAAIKTALNWEVSGHAASGWAEAWYATVGKADPTLARDLSAAVTLDVGRDGVPVVAAVDTFELPNWQAANPAATPHTRHAVAIVGYDNAANPPTFTYIDTCGRGCNGAPGNTNGGMHVIAQAALVQALQDRSGSGFIW